MAEDPRKPPPPTLEQHLLRVKETPTVKKGGQEQLRHVIRYPCEEYLSNSPHVTDAEEVLKQYNNQERELYDLIIYWINEKLNVSAPRRENVANIFNEYAGITHNERTWQTAPDSLRFQAIGVYKADGYHAFQTAQHAMPPAI